MIENIYKGSFTSMGKYDAQERYQQATYKNYLVKFRIEDDTDIIAFIEANKGNTGTTQLFREALQMLIDSKKQSRD